MYDSDHGPRAEMKQQECKPDYEEMAASIKKKMDVYVRFKVSLLEFMQIIGGYGFKREPSSLPELLGKVEFDCVQFEKEYNLLLSKIEDGSG